jgi:hypothetical protein
MPLPYKTQIYYGYNYPNPFSKNTTIKFRTFIYTYYAKVEIFTFNGELIKGWYDIEHYWDYECKVVWDGTNENGEKISSGVYLALITIKDLSEDILNQQKIATKAFKIAILR